MRFLFLLSWIALGVFVGNAQAQGNSGAVPRFSKYDIEDSGCKVYLPKAPENIDVSYSQDSSLVYTLEVDPEYWSPYRFGLIVVKLKDVDLNGQEEDMLKAYMDFLKTTLNITSSAGYGLGHTLNTHSTAKGVLDYWLDDQGDDWVVKGWAAESTLTIMYIYGNEPFDNINIQQLFFNGFRFPGD
jgi:hypothetical protein